MGAPELYIFMLNLKNGALELYIFTINLEMLGNPHLEMGAHQLYIFTLNLEMGAPGNYIAL